MLQGPVSSWGIEDDLNVLMKQGIAHLIPTLIARQNDKAP